MKEVKSFTIDRAKWGKGACLNEDGTMCCLGFYAKACGLTNSDIKLWGVPHYGVPSWATLAESYGLHSDVSNLVSWNDNSHASGGKARRCRADVEKAITKIFARHDVKVTFRGKAKKSS